MRKIVAMLVFTVLVITSSAAFASLGDTRVTIEQQYGDYRLVIDADNQLWTKKDWEVKGSKRAKAASYLYSFNRQGIRIQMYVLYDGDKAHSLVRTQRFSPDVPIKVKELKVYFPEVYTLVTLPKAQVFATYSSLSRHFQEAQSPVRMGVLIKELSAPKQGSYYPLLAFNVQDEGRLVNNIEYINEDTYIKEFTIERTSRTTVHSAMESSKPEWKLIKNNF
ncbi:MAG: hypothetical protein H7X79_04720 [Sporomusaceae bacterium]|nr:hypothetical protein [Sporomusaceae bacterium]